MLFSGFLYAGDVDSSLYLKTSISGKISPKSVVHNGNGVFYAQNMMYKHTVTVYNRKYELIETIKDGVNPSKYGFKEYNFSVKGGPVECAFSHNGKYAWVSNYYISGGDSTHFANPGCDACSGSGKYDSSFVYKINVTTNQIEQVIRVGSVPKYVATSPDNKWVLVSNWSSGDVSLISIVEGAEVKRLKVGTFPRGIIVDSKSKYAYVTIMGSTKLARIDLADQSVSFIEGVGKGPRHLCISPDDQYLYITLNTENKIAKVRLSDWNVQKLKVGHQPRSMAITGDGKYLYVVNYNDDTFSKVDAKTLKVLAITPTKNHPIGITVDDLSKEIWVACYSGYIQVFKDSLVKSKISLELKDELESGQLAINEADKAVVASLSESKEYEEDRIVEVQGESISENTEDLKKGMNELLPIRRLYLDHKKDFSFVKSETVVTVSKVEIPKENEVVLGGKLNFDQPYLVIVGSFKEKENAKTMIKMMKDLGLSADTFFSETKGLNYVFVFGASTLEEAKNWADDNIQSKTEFWVMHK
ncbi:MAG: beta-propeller fold lactonase family protein [Flavobacteriales bacterium]|nr:beta-propeller fold lactonase family protein [Flavobacteriales bacterium]